MHRVRVIDSHTEGEPTRVIVGGAPALPGRTVAERAKALAGEFDWFRRGVVNEPRGNDVMVGALLLPPDRPSAAAGVIYFNSSGVLGMCGHGTMGVVRTLAHMARLKPGALELDTPVGPVTAELEVGGAVGGGAGGAGATVAPIRVHNVRSYVGKLDVALTLEHGQVVHGDIAWGGNGFFLCADHGVPVDMQHLDALQAKARSIAAALGAAGLGQIAGSPVNHIELFAPPGDPANNSRNYVLCPSGEYDRSPCGTGTCAKLACLAARGQLQPGQRWRQESVIGSVFDAWFTPAPEGGIMPVISGRAWITAETELIFEDSDPCKNGL